MFEKSGHFKTINILNAGMDTAALRHNVISNNIANANTPGYKKRTVGFETFLKKAISGPQPLGAKRTRPRHIEFSGVYGVNVKPIINVEADTTFRNDQNNVDIDVEMANLAKNSINYEAFAERVSGMFKTLGMVINESK